MLILLRCGIIAVKNLRKVSHCRALCNGFFAHLYKVGAPHKLLDRANAQLCHNLAQFFGNIHHKVYNVFGLAAKTFSKLGVLRGNTTGAGIKVAHAHHNAAHGNQRSGCKTEFLRTQNGCNRYVSAAHQLTVGFKYNA